MGGKDSNFSRSLLGKIRYHLECPECRYDDNSYQYYVFGSKEHRAQDAAWLGKFKIPSFKDYIEHSSSQVIMQAHEKEFLYELLGDAKSRDLLLTVATYHVLGHRLVKLPFYVEDHREKFQHLNQNFKCQDDSETAEQIASNSFDVSPLVALYDLEYLGIPGKAYCHPELLLGVKEYGVYSYENGPVSIKIEPGDYVFDCGAAFGDTALIFAHLAGEAGKVFSFEPHPRMSKLLEHNISINPLGRRISIINKAVADKLGDKLGFNFGSTGSTTSTVHNQRGQNDALVETTSIDHEVASRGLERLDFLKMDIEGAELDALIGALNSLKRFRPKLAISVYHKYGDCKAIPTFINNLGLGYRFYFDHHSMNEWESVLYAIAE